MTRPELAQSYFEQGYACSQALVLAFKDLIDISDDILKKIALPFGGGLGRLRQTCGAISGIAIVVGLLFSKEENTEENKTETYKIVQELVKRFKEKRQTINCLELLKAASLEVETGGSPEARTKEYYAKRPCGKVVYDAAYVLDEYLKEKNQIKAH